MDQWYCTKYEWDVADIVGGFQLFLSSVEVELASEAGQVDLGI